MLEIHKTVDEEPHIVNKETEVALIFNREEGRMSLVMPSLDGETMRPEEVALVGIFHLLSSDQDFLAGVYNHVAANPELLEKFGLAIDVKALQ